MTNANFSMAKRTIYFKQICVHSVLMNQGESSFSFFTDNAAEQTESITKQIEYKIVEWIFNHPLTKSHFINSVTNSTSPYNCFLEVKKPVIEHGQNPGDVDILLWPQNSPELAIAIECKRVIVKVDETGKEKANRLSELSKGIKQANQLRELGFHKRYVAFIILTDGRNKKWNNTIFRSADSSTIEEIYNVPWNEELHSDVGVIYLKITQPTGVDFNLQFDFGVCVDKEAAKLEQPRELTQKIIKLFNGNQ